MIDIGYEDGEQFCKNLLNTGDFAQGLLSKFLPRGKKGGKKEELAVELAPLLMSGEVDADAFLLEYCKQPRMWLCVRRGTKASGWKQLGKAIDFLSSRKKGSDITWYGPFGSDEAERWYIAARNVETYSVAGNTVDTHWIRWTVIAQVTPTFVALHWNNFMNRPDKNPAEGFKQFPYYRRIPEIFRDLEEELVGAWETHEPNLADVVLHGSFDRYGDREDYTWKHKRIRASYNTVALNATGGTSNDDDDEDARAERAATGLQILTTALATTAVEALGQHPSNLAKVERALLRHILHEWGTKSYEFILDRKSSATTSPPAPGSEEPDDDDDLLEPDEEDMSKPKGTRVARMHIYFGTETPRSEDAAGIDSLQHVRCYQTYGFSTEALRFILDEVEQHAPTPFSDDGPDADYDEHDYDDDY